MVCHQNSNNPPTCSTYYSTASASVTITSPSHRTTSASASGLVILNPEADLVIGTEMSGEWSVNSVLTYACGGTTYYGFFWNYFRNVFTRSKWNGSRSNCHTTVGVTGYITTCDFGLIPWCTAEETPSDYAPSVENDSDPPSQYYQPTFVDGLAGCFRPYKGVPWVCKAFSSWVNHIPTYPRGGCSKGVLTDN
jgi:hypothetical protein